MNGKQPRLEPNEDAIQCAFIEWCRVQRDERRHAFHIPNEGKRSKLGHAIAKRKGLRKGASDNFIPAARGGWHGLFLELKAKDNRPTDEQQTFGEHMAQCGYCFVWAATLDEAMRLTEAYMRGALARANWVHFEAPAKR